MPELSCDDLAVQLATAATPALLLDTCTILDIEAVVTEAHDKLKNAANEFAEILTRIRALYPDICIPGAVDLLSLGLPQRGRILSEQIIQKSFILADHADEVMDAYTRVRLAKPPSTKAKQSMKDCLIAESYLRLAATLHTGGFGCNVAFATSNTRDYQQGHSSLHPELRAEFDSACLEYAPSWSAARHELDRYRTPLPPPTPSSFGNSCSAT